MFSGEEHCCVPEIRQVPPGSLIHRLQIPTDTSGVYLLEVLVIFGRCVALVCWDEKYQYRTVLCFSYTRGKSAWLSADKIRARKLQSRQRVVHDSSVGTDH